MERERERLNTYTQYMYICIHGLACFHPAPASLRALWNGSSGRDYTAATPTLRLYKILFHFNFLWWKSIILLLPSPHLQRRPYSNTIAHPLRNIRPATESPFVCHTPHNIGDGNEQALVCLSNREIVDASRGRTFHCKMANNRFF